MTATQTDLMVPEHGQEPARANPAPPEYMKTFDGMGVQAFGETVQKILAEPPDPRDVEIKPDGIVFLPGVWYRHQLTRAFGAGGWGIAERSPPRVIGNVVMFHAALVCQGRVVATAVGECQYHETNANMSYASSWEGAKTDAIGRCCKDLGMAWQLWDRAWREKWQAEHAEQYEGEKRRFDKRENRWVTTRATMWRRRDKKTSSAVDMASGAGGVAPVADAASSSSGPAPAAPDTGEAATDEQKTSIKNMIGKKGLAWTNKYMRLWFVERFGDAFKGADNPLERCTKQQADSAFLLISSWGNDPAQPATLYQRVLDELKSKGEVL